MTVPKEVIDEQLKQIGDFSRWFTKKEIKYLPQVIEQGEVIKAITSGMHDGNSWLIVVTQRRVLFLDKGMIYGLKQLELPLSKIGGINFKTKLMFGTIEIDTSGAKKKIEQIDKKDVGKVAKAISELISEQSHSQGFADASKEESTMDKLERLGALKEKGILTEEEFEEQKKKLLASI